MAEGLVMVELKERDGNGRPIHQFKPLAEAQALVAAGGAKPSRPQDQAKLDRAVAARTAAAKKDGQPSKQAAGA